MKGKHNDLLTAYVIVYKLGSGIQFSKFFSNEAMKQ